MVLNTTSRLLRLGCLLVVVGCGSDAPAGGGGTGGSEAGGASAGSTGGVGGSSSGGADGTAMAGADDTAMAGADGTAMAGADGTAMAGADGTAMAGTGGTAAGDTPPIPATVAGQVSVVVRDQGKDIPFNCTGGVGAAAPTYTSSGSITYFSVLCSTGGTDHPRIFRLTVTAMAVPLGTGTHSLGSKTAAPVPNLAVSVVDNGEGFSASNFNGDGGVSFTGVLTLDAVGAAKGDTVAGSFVASWTHVPIVTGNLTTGVAARAGSIAVSFSFARS